MLHKEILRQLFPLELGGNHDGDLHIEGHLLDEAMARAENLLLEIFPDTTSELLTSWERICGLSPSDGSPLQQRSDNVVAKLREVGGLSRAYFIALAASMGYTITIDEYPTTSEPHEWKITFTEIPVYEFYAGESCADELLLDWPSQTAAEGLFKELKPAHSTLIIAYS